MSALRDSCRRFDQRESSLKFYTVEILCADFVFGRSLNLHVDWKDLASFTAWSGTRIEFEQSHFWWQGHATKSDYKAIWDSWRHEVSL